MSKVMEVSYPNLMFQKKEVNFYHIIIIILLKKQFFKEYVVLNMCIRNDSRKEESTTYVESTINELFIDSLLI